MEIRLTGAPMGHVTEDAPRIADNLVSRMPLDMADEPDSTHRERCFCRSKDPMGVNAHSRVGRCSRDGESRERWCENAPRPALSVLASPLSFQARESPRLEGGL